MKQNDQKENRRDFLKNIGFGLFGISVWLTTKPRNDKRKTS